jgi:hypothetical protein
MRKVIAHGAWLLAAAVSVAGCASAASTSATGGPTTSSSASVQPSGASTAASTASPAPTAVASGPQYTATASAAASPSSAAATTPLGLIPIPTDANAWTTNTDALMGLDAYIDQCYDPASRPGEKSLYSQRGFVSGAFEGWFKADGSQQTIAIARFASATGATYAFSDLSGSFSQEPAPTTVFTDSADGAVGSADPTLDSQGNTFIDITAHVGDYLVDVHEFSARTPDTSAAKALLLKQVEALKSEGTGQE